MQPTIVALGTPPALSALAVVRLSGPSSVEIADRLFVPISGKPLSSLPGYHASYGTFFLDGRPLDDGIALVLRGPKSYTGEDMVELSCHGNPRIAARLVAGCVFAGASPAAAGEFTRRAFENGKLDLAQAEAVAELISAEGASAAIAALERRSGALSREIDALCDALSLTAAELTMWGDYPEEEDTPAVTREGLLGQLCGVRERLDALCRGYRSGKMLQNGISVAIVGSPNVGKSTLLNRLSGRERSIVTAIPGTTRDIVEERVELGGITLRLLDTAGIHATEDAVEKLGVKRALDAIETSDLVLFLLDRSRPFQEEEQALLGSISHRPHLVLANKADLPAAPQGSFQQTPAPDVEISAETGEGLRALEEKVMAALGLQLTQDHCLIASERQFFCVSNAAAALSEAIEAARDGITLDAVGVLLDSSIAPLAELTGRQVSEAVLEQVFSHFCVGK